MTEICPHHHGNISDCPHLLFSCPECQDAFIVKPETDEDPLLADFIDTTDEVRCQNCGFTAQVTIAVARHSVYRERGTA